MQECEGFEAIRSFERLKLVKMKLLLIYESGRGVFHSFVLLIKSQKVNNRRIKLAQYL